MSENSDIIQHPTQSSDIADAQMSSAQNEVVGESSSAQNDVVDESSSEQNDVVGESSSAHNDVVGESSSEQNDVVGESSSAQNDVVDESSSEQNDVVGESSSAHNDVVGESSSAQNDVVDVSSSCMQIGLKQKQWQNLTVTGSRSVNLGTVNKHYCKTESPEFTNLKHLSFLDLKNFNPEDYVETETCQETKQKLCDCGIVSLIGSPGSGKTTLGKICMKRLCEQENRQPLILTEPSEVDRIPVPEDLKKMKHKDTYIVFIDDIFGKANLVTTDKHSWEKKFEKIRSLVTYGLIKVIITMRTQIFSQCKESLSVNKFLTFLNFTHISLSIEEKFNILEYYLNKKKEIEMDKEDKIMAVRQTFDELGFPQCSSFYITCPEAQKRGVNFFKRPIEYLKIQLDQVKSDNPLQYLALLLVMFKQGAMRTECLNPFKEDLDTRNLIQKLKHVCRINGELSNEEINQSAKSLCGVYLEHSDSLKGYSFIHQSVFDTLFLHFSNEYFEEAIMICPAPMLVDYVTTHGVSNDDTIKLMVEPSKYSVLAQRFTDLLKCAESARSILSHPSFNDEQFLEYLITESLHSVVLNDILFLNLSTKEEREVTLVDKSMIHRWWDSFDTDISYFRCNIHYECQYITNTSSVAAVAVINNSKHLSKYLATNLVKRDSSVSENQQDLLEAACLKGNAEVVDILLKGGVVPTHYSFTAAAVSDTDDASILSSLFKDKHDLDINDLGYLLFLALRVGNEKISNLLIDKIGGMENSIQILDEAVRRLLIGLFEKFFDRRLSAEAIARLFKTLSIYTKLCMSNSALLFALRYDSASILKEIVNIDPSLLDTVSADKTLLHHAVRGGCLESLNILLDHVCDISAVDHIKQTALHVAALLNQSDMVQVLLQKGAKANSVDDKLNSPLHFAAKWKLEMVSYLVDNGAQINHENESGSTALHIAAQTRSMEIVSYLVKEGAEVNKQDKDGFTALHFAAQNRSMEIVSYLVKEGAEVNKQSKEGVTALHHAAQNGSMEIVRYLVKEGAEVNKQSENGITALHCAAQNGSMEIVNDLVGQGAHVHCVDKCKRTPLHFAAANMSLDVLCCLVKNKSQVNHQDIKGYTTLHLAAQNCRSVKMVEYLLEEEADVNKQNRRLETALHIAVQCGSVDSVKCLVEHGAEVSIKDEQGKTPLHFAATCNLEIVHYLVDKGAQVNLQDKSRHTPLHIAAKNKKSEIVDYLIKKGADVNLQNKSRDTALHYAVQKGSLEIVKYLVQIKAQVNIKNQWGQTPLHLAAKNKLEIASYLVEKEATVNIQDKSGDTPLYNAVYYRSLELVRYLVEKEAQINIRNQCGKSPVDIAAQSGSLEIVRYLVEKRALTETEKYTSLIGACFSGQVEVVNLLLEKGADPNYGSVTAMHIAAGLHLTSILQVLQDKGGDVNALTNSGNSPLHVAMRYDLECACSQSGIKQTCIDYLLCDNPHYKPEKRMEIEYDSPFYVTMFFEGIPDDIYDKYDRYSEYDKPEPEYQSYDYDDIYDDIDDFLDDDIPEDELLPVDNTGDWLLENNCHIDAQNEAGQTALHVCVVYYQLENLKLLLKRGADVSLVDNDGNPVLHYAVDRLHVEGVETLVESGAVDIKNNDGVTASDLIDRKVVCSDDEDVKAKCFKIIFLLTQHYGSYV